MKKRLGVKAQTTLEYAILIGVVVAGLIAMQMYLKRSYQGKLRESADDLGEQFSPSNTKYDYTVNTGSRVTETVPKPGKTDTQILNQYQNITGIENVSDMDKETWWKRW